MLLGCSGSADSKPQKAHAAALAPFRWPWHRSEAGCAGLSHRAGTVTAFNTANIKSRVDGQIMKVNFREGQDVRQGELLIEIDARPYEVQVEQLQAQLFRDQARCGMRS